MKPFKIVNNYVYIVLEHAHGGEDAYIHGVYINKDEARGKYISILIKKVSKKKEVSLSILKKPIHGKQRDLIDALGV